MPFLHDRSRISPWIKSIPSEFDIYFTSLRHNCLVSVTRISNRVCRHQQDFNREGESWGRCVGSSYLSSFNMDWCVRNKIMYSRDELFMRSFECCVTREINNKITRSWVHKQFLTRIYIWFSLYIIMNEIFCTRQVVIIAVKKSIFKGLVIIVNMLTSQLLDPRIHCSISCDVITRP